MYWEFAILGRKLAIVSIAVGLRGSTSYQLAMMLLVLFVAFAAQACLSHQKLQTMCCFLDIFRVSPAGETQPLFFSRGPASHNC